MARNRLVPLLALGATLAAAPATAEGPRRAPTTKPAAKVTAAQIEAALLKRFRAVPGMAGATRKTDVFACCCDSRCTFGIVKTTAEQFGATLPAAGRLRDTPTPELMAKAILRHVGPR